MKQTSSSNSGLGTPPLFPRHATKAPVHNSPTSSTSSTHYATPQSSPTPSTASSAIDEAWDAMLPTPRRRRFGGWGGAAAGGSPGGKRGGLGGLMNMKRADSAPALTAESGTLILPPSAAAAAAAAQQQGAGGIGGRSASSNALSVWGQRLSGSGKALLGHSPRDAMGGVSGGVATVAAGIGLGITSLVAAPALGASSHGAKGFLAGLGAGLAGAVVLPVVGVVGGLTCAIGGVVNTPASVVQMLRGRQWCPLQRKWIRYDLHEEARRVLGDSGLAAATAAPFDNDMGMEEDEETQAPPPAAPQPPAPVGSTGGGGSLYAVLGVDPSADAEAIKRAYYREALTVHPDRTSDPEAKARFQQLSEAYQVLSTPALRASYDKEGDAAFRDTQFIEPDLFFGLVFGSDRFRPYLGKLFLASAMGALSHFAGEAAVTGSSSSSTTPAGQAKGDEEEEDDGEGVANAGSLGEARAAMTTTQVKREVRIALHLTRILKPLLEGRPAPFHRFCEEEAKELSQRALGPLILRELGTVYTQVAGAYLGGLSGLGASLDRRRVRLQRQAEVAGATIEAVKLGKKFVDVYSSSSSSNGTNKHHAARRPPPSYHRSSSAPTLSTPSHHKAQPPSPSNNSFTSQHTAGLSLSASSSNASLLQMTPPDTLTPEAPAYYFHAAAVGEECKEEPQQANSKEQQLEEEGLPRLVSVMWKLAAWDITETVGRACGKLLSDAGAGKEERRLRAQGLMELGRAFKAEAARCLEAAGGKVDYRREWEGLDREMFRRYESSASIHTMATPTATGPQQQQQPPLGAAAVAAHEGDEDDDEEDGVLVL